MSARGARFHTVDVGAAETWAVLLHGLFTGSVASWYLTVASGLSAHVRLRLLDWRGHGLSERTPTGYGSDSMADDLAAVTADLPRFVLIGHSFGAIVATRFATARPDRVRRLVLVEPPLADPGRPWWTQRETAAITARSAALDAESAGRRRAPVNTIGKLLAQTSIVGDLERDPPFGAAEIGALADVPTVVVAGADSPFRPAAEALVDVHPQLACHVLPGGHELQVDCRHDLTRLLVAAVGDGDGPG